MGTIFAVYSGKSVAMDYIQDPKKRFPLACARVMDNAGKGYVVDGEKVYSLSGASRMAKFVTDPEERIRVFLLVAAR